MSCARNLEETWPHGTALKEVIIQVQDSCQKQRIWQLLDWRDWTNLRVWSFSCKILSCVRFRTRSWYSNNELVPATISEVSEQLQHLRSHSNVTRAHADCFLNSRSYNFLIQFPNTFNYVVQGPALIAYILKVFRFDYILYGFWQI